MKLILTLLMSSVFSAFFAQQYSRCKILTGSEGLQTLSSLGIAVDHGTTKKNTFFISDFSSEEMQLMTANGFEFEVLIPDVVNYYQDRNKGASLPDAKNANCAGTGTSGNFTPTVPSNFHLGSMGGYYTYQQFLNELDEMAALYPNLITVKAPISNFQTIQNRPIYFVKISDNPNEDESEPEVLYTSIHHAREPASLSQLIFYMWYLLENYSSSEEIAFLLNNTEMYFVPMVNPDGYVYNETTEPSGGGMWRKNRRNNGGSFGVDLNRNYSYGWNTTGVSSNPSGETYPGTSAFSEPETQAMKWFCENRDFQFAFNAHTYADDILFPIGTTVAEYAEDHDYFNAFTGHMVKYNGYTHMKSSSLYPASGDSDDYMYKVDLAQKPKIFAMTPEIGSNQDGFWPAQSDITGICQEMVFPNLILSHLTHQYYAVDETDPTTIETLAGNFNHSVERFGLADGDVIVSITPLEGIESIGTEVTYNLAIMGIQAGSISYTLNPTIQFGDVIKYVLNTNLNGWIRHDTITKSFGSLSLQFADDATNSNNWTGTFGITSATFVSPSSSFTDSPSGDYPNNANRTYTLNNAIDLTHVSAANCSFYAKWDIEADYDFARMEVSLDNGITWIGQCGLYTHTGSSANGSVQPDGEPVYDGLQSNWVFEEIDLSDYIGQTIKIRFILRSDGGERADGFYFDDFKISYNEIIDHTGLQELDLSVKVIPNPANEQVYISFGQPVSKGEIIWFDQTGKKAGSRQINEITNKIVLETANLPQGIYHIRYISAESTSNAVKMVVIH